ncbi:MAG: serine/threonine protein kinase [Fimbriiglobus sp.]|jgi:serine/threonine-protein kinase|nr:serine/threonine protein kinase [Fimbriiglobus sp.]
MPTETSVASVESLFFRWKAFRAVGRELSPAALCRDCPELAPLLAERIAAEGESDDDAAERQAVPPDSDGTIARPSTSEPGSDPSDTMPVGRFEVVREVARGGMGRVCEAVDTELNRRVAFKDIQGKFANDPATRGRFVREALITGQLEHPGVIPVYGLGTGEDGRPYYAMRFVEGQSLKDAAAEFHRTPLKRPPAGEQAVEFRGLLKRFADVCNAVAFAHSKRIVHRDLKPANVMLGPFGETLVVDWGLARSFADKSADVVGATEWPKSEADTVPNAEATAVKSDTDGTRTGQMMGTPAYMSPEQAAGQIRTLGPAWDIYSLGATLYHLLTGRPPYTGKPMGELIRDVLGGVFLPPREVAGWVPKSLDAVVRKAMAREAKDRYTTAMELAAEIDRYLADEPVQAYRETAGERARRWARRNRGWVRAGLMAVLATFAVLAVSLVVVNGAREAAEESERLKTGALKREEKSNDGLRKALDSEKKEKERSRAALDLTTDELLGKLLGKLDRLGPDDEAFLNKLIATYGELANNPDDQALSAAAHMRVGQLYRHLGNVDAAAGHYRSAIEKLETIPSEGRTSARRDLGTAKIGYARTALLTDGPGAVRALREALLLREETYNANRADPQAQEDLAVVLLNAAEVQMVGPMANAANAEKQYQRLVNQFADALRSNPRTLSPVVREAIAMGSDQLAMLHERKTPPKPGEASRAYDNALTVLADLKDQFPTEPRYQNQWVNAMSNRAMLKAGEEKWAEVYTDLSTAVALGRTLVRENPSVRDYRQVLAIALVRLAQVVANHPAATGKDKPSGLALLSEAYGHMVQLHTRYPEVDLYGELRHDLGQKLREAYERAGRDAEADQLHEELKKAPPPKR